ncbi:alpha/beta fold hydrolase [Acidocella aromatica]|uniref:Pimeloyl-ACP methyl ester carboxylesterase n=1 Tax=Acidocella aromatica TaxID=1303579 RepID=A0A840VTC6_9PROT|nr:alpha/beta fold hydrolase [Acidocella aromatica]MBB5373472.1 pimeloyl-ACP methyl ester carboxylesterase [Acidocella aromatica]
MSMILNATQMGEGEPLVLLHGLFGAARNLGVLSRGLSGKARVIALDLRNHGESPHGLPMDFVTMAADVAETLAYLGLERVKLAGHSLGGKTAMALALTRPELVEKLVVMDIAPIAYDHDYDDYVAAMLAIELHPGLTRAVAEQALAQTVKAAPMRAFLLNNLVLGANPHWRVGLKEIQAAMPDMLNWVDPPGCQPFTAPALFLSGALSDYVGAEADEPIRRLFPNAMRQRIEGAAHWLHADKPAEVLASLQEFFGL